MRFGRSDYHIGRDDDSVPTTISNALADIPEDEPVFLLRAQDIAAPGAVREWANALEDNLGAEALVLIDAARAWAREMETWQKANIRALPDVPDDVTLG